MRLIVKKMSPEAQRAIQQYKAEKRDKANWSDFQNPGKGEVRKSIVQEQGCICAYCMGEIEAETAQIEHWTSQEASKSNKNMSETIDYDNLLAVCSGGKVHGQSNYSKLYHCDTSRSNGNRNLSVKPTKANTLLSIEYLGNGFIQATCTCGDTPCSDLACIHCDLVCPKGLNLNILKLSDRRREVLQTVQRAIKLCRVKHGADVKRFDADRKKILNNFIGSSEKLKPYCGIIESVYKKYL